MRAGVGLRTEIALVIAVKLALLAAIYSFLIEPREAPPPDTATVTSAILGPSGPMH